MGVTRLDRAADTALLCASLGSLEAERGQLLRRSVQFGHSHYRAHGVFAVERFHLITIGHGGRTCTWSSSCRGADISPARTPPARSLVVLRQDHQGRPPAAGAVDPQSAGVRSPRRPPVSSQGARSFTSAAELVHNTVQGLGCALGGISGLRVVLSQLRYFRDAQRAIISKLKLRNV